MKKILFGSISAIIAVIGFSSFRNTKAFSYTYYWFEPTANIPSSNLNPTFAQIGTYKGFISIPTGPCTGTTELCFVGYTVGQLFFTGATPVGLHTNGLGLGIPTEYRISIVRDI